MRLAGWLALGLLVVYLAFKIFYGEEPHTPIANLSYVHSFLLLVCGIVVLGKIYKKYRDINVNKPMIMIWIICIFILGTGFFILTASLALWKFEFPLRSEIQRYTSYQFLLVGHAVLALILILMGRFILNLKSSG